MVIFRENIEDIYAGIEGYPGTKRTQKLIDFLRTEWNVPADSDSLRYSAGISVKPMSPENTKRLVRKAIQYAIDKKRRVVTICHKGNIMKATEGQFRNWGYEVAIEEFRNQIVTEKELNDKYDGDREKAYADGKILVNDRIMDAMFQQVLLRPREYEVVALPNLNGDYLSTISQTNWLLKLADSVLRQVQTLVMISSSPKRPMEPLRSMPERTESTRVLSHCLHVFC
jgi:isocitrate dehydrogenase